MLIDALVPRLDHHFPRLWRLAGDGTVVFPAKHPDVGDIAISDDGDGLTVRLGRFTHTRIANADDSLTNDEAAERIADKVIALLTQLFADKIELSRGVLGSGIHRRSRGHRRGPFVWLFGRPYVWSGPVRERVNPFPAAFSTTLAAVLFLSSGLVGYDLSKRSRVFRGTAWAPAPIGWELVFGVAFAFVAIFAWRRALRSLHESPAASTSGIARR